MQKQLLEKVILCVARWQVSVKSSAALQKPSNDTSAYWYDSNRDSTTNYFSLDKLT